MWDRELWQIAIGSTSRLRLIPSSLCPPELAAPQQRISNSTAQQKPPLPSYPGQRHIGNSYYLPEPYSIYKHDAESLDRMNVKRLQIVL